MAVVVLILWSLVCWVASRLMRHWTGSRIAYWLTFAVMFLLPWADGIIGVYVAKSYYAKFGHLMPDAPIPVEGFLMEERRNGSPSLYYELSEKGFGFVEVEYTERIYETPSMVSGPGFYQFRALHSPVSGCTIPGVTGKPAGVFAVGGYCYAYARSDRPMSRYSYVSDPWTLLRSNVEKFCLRLVDLRTQADVARSCFVKVSGPLGLPMTHLESPDGITEVMAVLQPQPNPAS